MIRNEEDRDVFFKGKQRNDNPVAGNDCARVNKSIIVLSISYSATKRPKHNKLRVSHSREKPHVLDADIVAIHGLFSNSDHCDYDM